MQGSFEKKVQEKLDSLKLTPSAPVWEKVEMQIEPPKKRRGAVLWFPFLITLLLGAAWWLWDGRREKVESTPAATITQAERDLNNTTNVNKPETKNTATTEEKQRVPVTNNRTTGNLEPLPAGPGMKSTERKETTFVVAGTARKTTGLTGMNNREADISNEQKGRKSLERILDEKIPTGAIVKKEKTEISNQNSTDREESNEQISTEKAEFKQADSATASTPVPVDSARAPAKKDTVAAKPKVASLNKKWKVTLTAQGGWTSPAPSLSSAARADYASSPSPVSSGGFSSNYAMPSRISGHSAFALGLGLSRDLSRRFAISIGLQYSTYSTVTKMGTFRPLDTAVRYLTSAVNVGGYYRNGNQQDYTSRMAVLELPVSINFKVADALPLYLSVGGSYGRLLSSNALTFNPSANFYYENDQAFNRNQAAFFSSLQYGLLHKKGFSLRAGPVVQYQLTSFQKERGTASSRLLFAGVKTTVHF